ncbi:MAG: hypothetical protein HXY30_05185 [Pseudorhodoplanes sp.]|nr:hypothetical protein [Pseudorhodoplanes sp.]
MDRLLSLSALILVVTNLVPLAGVLYWNWDLFLLLILYWFDTAIIGFWMMVQALREPPSDVHRGALGVGIVFVTFHAGIFMTVHFVFLWSLFSGPWRDRVDGIDGFMAVVILGTGLWVPIVAMVIGRGLVTLVDLRKAYAWVMSTIVPPDSPADASGRRKIAIHAFYARIVVMHLTILGGAFLMQSVGSVAPLIILIALKTAIDLGFEGFSRMRTPDIPQASKAARPDARPPAGM